jgi:excisionase family DNA binding protein
MNDDAKTVAMMTTAEVAKQLGISRHAVYRAVATGRLPCRVWKRQLVFLTAELNTYFESLPRREPTPARAE